jgi:NAD(P) transhydrogenase subunit alpha
MAKVFIPKETRAGETRIAASPESVKQLVKLKLEVEVESGAGRAAHFTDEVLQAAGAKITAAGSWPQAELVLKVQPPSVSEIARLAPDTIVISLVVPSANLELVEALRDRKVSTLAMDLIPRITRAQAMDVLSSQATVAGYKAVLLGASQLGKLCPMLMTAAGTIPAARAVVFGAGVAGLQAIATAKRLGAIVSATDVRAATKEQVQSLGGTFVMVEDEEFKQAETAAGYAKPMSAEYQAKQAALTATHIAKQDIVITTALIPGRPAPKLITKAMIDSMAPGSVIVDLAAERGGNVELTQPGKVVVTPNGVTVIGYTNVPGRLATSASQLYARNLYAFVETLVDKKTKTLAVNWDDELVKATMLTKDGAVVHANIVAAANAGEAPAKAAPTAKPAATAKAAPAKTAKPAPAAKTASPAAAITPAKAPAAAKPVAAKPAATKKPAAVKVAAASAPAAAPKPVEAKPDGLAKAAAKAAPPAKKPAANAKAPAKPAASKAATAKSLPKTGAP